MVDLEPISSAKRGPRRELTGSLGSLFDNYMRNLKLEGCTEATLIHKRKQLQPFLKWLEGQGHSMAPADLTPFDIQEHLEGMEARGNAVNTRHTRLRSIRAWCNWMVAWKLIEESPCALLKSPRLPQEGKGFISEADFRALLAWCPQNTLLGARRAAMLWVMLTSGLRAQELASLNMGDLDWDAETIHVRKGKGQKERWAPFSPDAQRATLTYIQQRKDDLECLWVSEEGGPIKRVDSIGYDIKRLMQRAGVEVQDRCHVFRRTFAAEAVRRGINRQYVMAALGWSTPTMLDRYVHAMQREAAALEAFKGYRAF